MPSKLKGFLVWAAPYLVLVVIALGVGPWMATAGYWGKVGAVVLGGVAIKLSQWVAAQVGGKKA